MIELREIIVSISPLFLVTSKDAEDLETKIDVLTLEAAHEKGQDEKLHFRKDFHNVFQRMSRRRRRWHHTYYAAVHSGPQ